MDRTTIVWIHRPNQGHHSIFSLSAGVALASRGRKVRILVCNSDHDYCVVKQQLSFAKERGKCSPCDTSINLLTEVYAYLVNNLAEECRPNISLQYTRNLFPDIAIPKESAINTYRDFQRWYLRGCSGHDIPNCDWLSEACSITGLTPYDFSKADITEELTEFIRYALKQKAFCRAYLRNLPDATLLVYNGRFAAAKSWITEFRARQQPFVVHESGLHEDSFTLNLGWSVEEHFLLRPKDFYPELAQIEEIACRSSGTDVLYSFIDYILPKLKGDKTYYQINALHRSPVSETHLGLDQPKSPDQTILLLMASSYDEVALPLPYDRTVFEQSFIENLVTRVIQENDQRISSIYIRFHPRSYTNLADSRAINGAYAQLIENLYRLASLSCGTEVIIVEPADPREEYTSYELIKKATHTVSLFSITALEAAAMGKPSIVHEFARGSTIMPAVLTGGDPESAVDQLLKWLTLKSYPDQKLASRSFLGKYLKSLYIYPTSFRYFSPLRNRTGNFLQHFIEKTSSAEWLDDVSWDTLNKLFR